MHDDGDRWINAKICLRTELKEEGETGKTFSTKLFFVFFSLFIFNTLSILTAHLATFCSRYSPPKALLSFWFVFSLLFPRDRIIVGSSLESGRIQSTLEAQRKSISSTLLNFIHLWKERAYKKRRRKLKPQHRRQKQWARGGRVITFRIKNCSQLGSAFIWLGSSTHFPPAGTKSK